MTEKGKKPIPKTQRQLSISQQEPYVPPNGSVGFSPTGNPNSAKPPIEDRGNQISYKGDNTKPLTLGFKEIDEAIFYYFDNVIKPSVLQNGQSLNVPVIYGNPQRWKQIQKDGFYRDKKGKIMMPLIVFKRNNFEKVRNLSIKLDSNSPNNIHVFEKSYSTRDAYNNFNLLNNRTPKKEYYAVIMPDYVKITYDFVVSTYYVEQLNTLIENIQYASDSYWGNPERFKFKAMINSFATPVEIVQGGERTVKATFQLDLYGYLIPQNIQKSMTSISKYSNRSTVNISNEVVTNLSTTPPPPRDIIEPNSND
tara:strand:- start:164 stop:1090 length:927 start_codon:yes stop_codon:yes gene_type:complete